MPRPGTHVVHPRRIHGARHVSEQWMPVQVTVVDVVHAKAAGGGDTTTTADLVTVVGRIRPYSSTRPEEGTIADRAAGRTVWTVVVPADTDVGRTNRLRVDGRTLEVLGVIDDSAELERRCVCAEVT